MVYSQIQVTRGRLRREIGLLVLIAVMIGLNIGGSLFVLPVMGARLTGPSLLIAQLVSALPLFLALPAYLTLTSAVPTTSANYQYAKLLSPVAATCGWMGLFVAIPIGALPLFTIVAANFVQQLFPAAPVTWVAIGMLSFFYLINVFGIKATTYLQFVAVGLMMVALLVFALPGLGAIEAANFKPLFTGGMLNFLGVAALFYTLLAGALFGIEMGDEVKDARRTIPRAMWISIIVVLVVYLLIELVTVGAANSGTFLPGDQLDQTAQLFLGKGLLVFFIIGGILAALTTVNLTLTAAGRYLMASAEDRFFPQVMSRVSRRFGTPHWGLTLAWGLAVATLLVKEFTSELDLVAFATILNFGLLFMVTMVLISAARLPGKHPALFARSRYPFGARTVKITAISAAVINTLFMVILAAGLATDTTKAVPLLPVYLFAAALVAGLVLYYFARRRGGYSQPGFLLDND